MLEETANIYTLQLRSILQSLQGEHLINSFLSWLLKYVILTYNQIDCRHFNILAPIKLNKLRKLAFTEAEKRQRNQGN